MLGYYNVSVILTYIGLLSSVVGIGFAMEGKPLAAVVCLLVCGVCDMFDGTIARAVRRNEEEKSFGIQIDSLCDLASFGLLPAVILLSLSDGVMTTAVACLYVLGAVIRLGFFNVHEQLRQKTTDADKTGYRGLPVTTIAWTLPMLYAFRGYMGSRLPSVLGSVMLIIGVLFVVDFRLNKPKRKLILYAAGCVWVAASVTCLALLS